LNCELSPLQHSWLIDIDGTIFRHNGHLKEKEELLPGVSEFWQKIPKEDFIILLTAREMSYERVTIENLRKFKIRFDHIIFGLPKGERIMLNDVKPSGLITAHAINIERDTGLSKIDVKINRYR
jgi:hypothetical protein